MNYVALLLCPDGDELKDMFPMHNGSGLRNMTLQGLTGTLGDLNATHKTSQQLGLSL